MECGKAAVSGRKAIVIRLGINTMIWGGGYHEDHADLFQRVSGMGYDAIEIPVFDFAAVNPAPIRHALEDTGLELTVSSAMPAESSLISDDAATRTRARCWLESAVEKVAAMGGSILAGPMYVPVGELPGRRRTPSEWARAVDEYRALGAAIRGSGVRIAVEPLNRFETYFLNTAEDARRLCIEIGNEMIGVLFDTFHANIEEAEIAAALASLGPHLIHVHLSENHRGIPGSGHVPFANFAQTLRNTGYSGYAVVESFASSIPEIARATAMWRDFAESPDEFARTAIENMRPLFPGE
jgi:D-psicose/D-tagatose/L-ribulose 3-epimerase